MNLWQSHESIQQDITEAVEDPTHVYGILWDYMHDVREMAESATAGNLSKSDLPKIRAMEQNAALIVAYCDTRTAIDSRPIQELLFSLVAAWDHKLRGHESAETYGPQRSPEEIEYLLRVNWGLWQRISNALFLAAANVGDSIPIEDEEVTYRILSEVLDREYTGTWWNAYKDQWPDPEIRKRVKYWSAKQLYPILAKQFTGEPPVKSLTVFIRNIRKCKSSPEK